MEKFINKCVILFLFIFLFTYFSKEQKKSRTIKKILRFIGKKQEQFQRDIPGEAKTLIFSLYKAISLRNFPNTRTHDL